jgi:hypothetical protein
VQGILWLAFILSLSIISNGSRADPIPLIHNLALIEFVESPPTGMTVSGGLLGVPDSSGAFPTPYRRFDPVTGNFADPGRVAGDVLVFANLRPGTYRLALVFLNESKFASRILPKHGDKFEDRCMVYSDSIPNFTFTIAEGGALPGADSPYSSSLTVRRCGGRR